MAINTFSNNVIIIAICRNDTLINKRDYYQNNLYIIICVVIIPNE